MAQIKVGDIVEHKDMLYTDLKVLEVGSDNDTCVLYSKQMSDEGSGHDGINLKSFNYEGNGDKHGHFFASLGRIVQNKTPETPYQFQIGDTVLYRNEQFTIVGDDKDGDYIVFSEKWLDNCMGHDGVGKHYEGNGYKYGHYYVNKSNFKLVKSITQHEIFRTDQQGCPGGIKIEIHSKSVQIASGCRPTGSRTTACRIGMSLGTGKVSNNRVQPH